LEREESRLGALTIFETTDDSQGERSSVWCQQESEVRKAHANYVHAEESKCLAELALHYDLSQGKRNAQNGQQMFLSALRASALARNRKIEEGTKAIEQVKRAKLAIVAAREKERREEVERAKKKVLRRPASSPDLRMPTLRFNWMHTGQTSLCPRDAPSSAPARTTSEDEQSRLQRDRWIQWVRESLQSRERRDMKSGGKRSERMPNLVLD
jgi:hypothetical protein